MIEPLDGWVNVNGVPACQHVGVEYDMMMLIKKSYLQNNVKRVEMSGVSFDFLVHFFNLFGGCLEYLFSLCFLFEYFSPERLIIGILSFLQNHLEDVLDRLLPVVLNQQFVVIFVWNLR